MNKFQAALKERRAVKAIAGIANFDIENVAQVARAAQQSGADALDVAARKDVVAAAKQNAPDVFLFASSVKPEELLVAVEAGVDGVELGNFDALYKEGLFYSYDDVLKLATETVELIGNKALVSITVPGHLSTDAQLQLLKELEALNVDVIQTEGAIRLFNGNQVQALSAADKAEVTLHNTRTLVAATRLPVMTASGLDAENVSTAFKAGASAVGIGSAVNQLETEEAMVAVLQNIMEQTGAQKVAAVS